MLARVSGAIPKKPLMQPTQVIPLLGIPVHSLGLSITFSLSVKELNTPRQERRCLLIHEYVAEPELQIALG